MFRQSFLPSFVLCKPSFSLLSLLTRWRSCFPFLLSLFYCTTYLLFLLFSQSTMVVSLPYGRLIFFIIFLSLFLGAHPQKCVEEYDEVFFPFLYFFFTFLHFSCLFSPLLLIHGCNRLHCHGIKMH